MAEKQRLLDMDAMDFMFESSEKKFLLNLARNAIIHYIEKNPLRPENITEKLKQKRATFVTLSEHDELRGCIGNLSGTQMLYESVINNATGAAFRDPRFQPVSKSEMEKIKIEISVLTEPEKINYIKEEDLLNNITEDDGIIIVKDNRSATFLPQVWLQIQDKEEFLRHLCMKALLPEDSWKEGADIYKYHVVHFSE